MKAHGIRVDLLALVERADEVLSTTKEVVDAYLAGETRLVMATPCHHQLQALFTDSMVYFRPALTPLALFSNSPSEILNFEGPESINTGIALAAALGMDELVLVGVDLGARSLRVRSDEAVGCSERDLNLEFPANFGGTVFTSTPLRDSRMAVEACFRWYGEMKVFNASDGVAIEGAEPQSLSQRVQSCSHLAPLDPFEVTPLGQWWLGSARYTPQRFLASWASRRPRAEVAALIASLQCLFRSDEPWFPVVIREVMHCGLDVALRRVSSAVLRSTIHKMVIAVNHS